MARKIFLENDWDIHRTQIAARGVPVADGLAVVGLLSLTKAGAAIHPSLSVSGTTAAAEFLATVQGYDLTTHLLALWETADGLGQKLKIYERVTVADADYSDYVELQVERDRPATEPEEA